MRVNVLSSFVVVACGVSGAGTVSEVALALKAKKPVILLGTDKLSEEFFKRLGRNQVLLARTPQDVKVVQPLYTRISLIVPLWNGICRAQEEPPSIT